VRTDVLATRPSSSFSVIALTSSTACANAASSACEGFCRPLTLRTYCNAAARISSFVVGGWKL
jgi:hypothetical protein